MISMAHRDGRRLPEEMRGGSGKRSLRSLPMVHRIRQTIGKLALAAATRRRTGFTLVEAVISTVIVAIMFVAALNTVGAARVAQYKAALAGRGRLYAEALVAEILQQNYQEPGAACVFGREAGESETNRTDYDDVDDYHGWTESPLAAKDGTALLNSTNWSRTVTVEWVDSADPKQVSGTETGAKRITVVAAFRSVPQATVVAVKTAE